MRGLVAELSTDLLLPFARAVAAFLLLVVYLLSLVSDAHLACATAFEMEAEKVYRFGESWVFQGPRKIFPAHSLGT